MIICSKCSGKVFVDFTFTENKNYEAFCLSCGKRWFVGKTNPLFTVFKEYIDSKVVV